MVKKGVSKSIIMQSHFSYYEAHHAFVDKMFTLMAPHRRWMPAVYWLHGGAGLNKSRAAHAVLPLATFTKMPGNRWFCGYDGHDVLILDDLRKETFSYNYLLQRFPPKKIKPHEQRWNICRLPSDTRPLGQMNCDNSERWLHSFMHGPSVLSKSQ